MAIYVTGDTHGDPNDIRFFGHDFLLKDLTKDDVLIICGDFAWDWNKQSVKEWSEAKREFTTVFCCGNHENYDILNSLPKKEMFGDEVGVFCDDTFYLYTGHMYIIENKKFFVFGGAASIDKDWRLAEEKMYYSPRTLWWSDEVPTEEQYELAKQTLEKHNWKFDYFISHTCNPELKGVVLGSYKANFFDPTENMISGLEYEIEQHKGNYKAHFFGHFHTNTSYKKEHCLYGNTVNITKKYYFGNDTNTRFRFYENTLEVKQ